MRSFRSRAAMVTGSFCSALVHLGEPRVYPVHSCWCVFTANVSPRPCGFAPRVRRVHSGSLGFPPARVLVAGFILDGMAHLGLSESMWFRVGPLWRS